MNQTEELVIKLAVIEEMLKTVRPNIDDARARVRSWLKTMSVPEAEVEQAVKVYLQISQAKTVDVPNEELLAEHVMNLLPPKTLKGLFEAGALTISDPSAVIAALTAKDPAYKVPMKRTTKPATDPDHAPLRIMPMSGARYDGLRNRVRTALDLDEVVWHLLEDPLPANAKAPATPRAPGIPPSQGVQALAAAVSAQAHGKRKKKTV